jgi:hypothetical protein
MRLVRFLLALASVVGCVVAANADAVALPSAHSHNDYEQKRPLHDALDHGFASVEADIHLVDGELLVAHDRIKVQRDRTLESLYLAPLHQRVTGNKGFVHPGLARFTLLIDIKADPEGTYAVLDPLLRRHREVLTRFTPDRTFPGAITVILSGARPTALVAAQAERFCAIDGRPEDLKNGTSTNLIPMVSEAWGTAFGRIPGNPLPEATRTALNDYVRRAHAQGRVVRFWGAPDREWFWNEMQRAGVDYINTDRIPDLAAFLKSRTHEAKPAR